jgi:hypothetical protein
LQGSGCVDHVVEITKLIEFDCLDGAHSVICAETVSGHFHTVALSASVVNTAHYSIRSLVLNMEVKILNFNLITINLRALSPHKHDCELSVKQIADERDLNIMWLSIEIEELSLGVLESVIR